MNKDELKHAKEVLKELCDKMWYDYTDEALAIIYANQSNDNYGCFISDDLVDEHVKHEAESGTRRVMFFLRDATPGSPFGYKLNGYGNLEDVSRDDLVDKLGDIIKTEEETNE